MPLRLPVDQPGGDLHLLGVDFRPLGLVEVLEEEVVAVHLRSWPPGRRWPSGVRAQNCGCGGAARPGRVRNSCMMPVARAIAVLEIEDVRHTAPMARSAVEAVGAPVMAVPGDDLAVGIGGNRHVDEARRPRAGDLQFRGPVEHQLHRLAGFFAPTRRRPRPIHPRRTSSRIRRRCNCR